MLNIFFFSLNIFVFKIILQKYLLIARWNYASIYTLNNNWVCFIDVQILHPLMIPTHRQKPHHITQSDGSFTEEWVSTTKQARLDNHMTLHQRRQPL